jgi:hypothetical protein
MYYATHRLYRSTNGGSSWSPISGDLTNGGALRAIAIAPSNTQTIYVASNDGNVMASFDGGFTFDLIASGNPGWPRVTRELFVDPSDDLTLYRAVAVFGTPHIQRTTDGGQSWEVLDGDLPDIPINVVAVDIRGAKPTLYAGADAAMYRSVDDGASWHRYGVGLPNVPVIDIILDADRSRLLAATQGRGAWLIGFAVPGDMNGDNAMNTLDIEALVLALTDPDGFALQYPDVDPVLNGDLNGDGALNLLDIEPFVDLLVG